MSTVPRVRVDLDDLALELGDIPAWTRDALCVEPVYIGLPWFPERSESATEAKAVCARCLVRAECLDYAMSNPVARSHGVCGGTSPRERRPPNRRAPRLLCELCDAMLPRGREGHCAECEEWLARYR